MKRNISIAGAALAVLMLAAIHSTRERDASGEAAHDATAAHAELEEVRSEIANLRRHVYAQNARSLSVQPQIEEADGETDIDEPVDREQTPEPDPPKAPETQAEFVANLSARFLAESVDVGWSREAAHLADGDLRPLLPAGSHITTLECKSSLCRAESMHQDMGTYQEFTRAMIHARRKWQGPAIVVVVDRPENGEVKAAIYMAKLGEDLLALATPTE